jgi:phage recombination protein Bet
MPAKTKPAITSGSIAFVSDENPLRLNATDIEILRASLSEATDLDFKRFIRVCERTRLDPITRQIYGRVQNEKVKGRQGQADTWKKSLVIITGIDGFRALAAHTGEYQGQTKPEWYYSKLGAEPEWHEAFIPSTDSKGRAISVPEVARVGVWRQNFREPCYGVANFEGFADYKYNKESKEWYLGVFWEKLGAHMIAKVAEAQAFRKAFPQELGGIYIEEEVSDLTEEEREAAAAHQAAENASQEPANRAPKVEKPAPPATKPATEKPAPVAEKPAPEPEKPAPKAKTGYTEAEQDPLFADEDGSKKAAPAADKPSYVLKVINNGAYKGKKLADLSDTQLATLKLAWADKFKGKSPEHAEESEQIEAELATRPGHEKTVSETRAALVKAGQLK